MKVNQIGRVSKRQKGKKRQHKGLWGEYSLRIVEKPQSERDRVREFQSG